MSRSFDFYRRRVFDLNVDALYWRPTVRRYWNDDNAVRTHFFSSMVYADRQVIGFCIRVCEKVLQSSACDIPEAVRQEVRAYVLQERLVLERYSEFITMQTGRMHYRDALKPDDIQRFHQQEEQLTLREQVLLAVAHKWMSHAICDYTLSNAWLLSGADAAPALMWRWQCVSELLHKTAVYNLLQGMGDVSQKEKRWAFSVADGHSRRLFWAQFLYFLRLDGCLKISSLPSVLRDMLRVQYAPGGFEWLQKRYRKAFIRKDSHPNDIIQDRIISEWMMNNNLNITEVYTDIPAGRSVAGAQHTTGGSYA